MKGVQNGGLSASELKVATDHGLVDVPVAGPQHLLPAAAQEAALHPRTSAPRLHPQPQDRGARGLNTIDSYFGVKFFNFDIDTREDYRYSQKVACGMSPNLAPIKEGSH